MSENLWVYSYTLLAPFISILVWKPPEGLNPSQALDLLQKRLEKLGGKSLGTWTVDCETLQSTPALGTVTQMEQMFCVLLVAEFWLGALVQDQVRGTSTYSHVPRFHVAFIQTASSRMKEEWSVFLFVAISCHAIEWLTSRSAQFSLDHFFS